jgi:hypothetical protein
VAVLVLVGVVTFLTTEEKRLLTNEMALPILPDASNEKRGPLVFAIYYIMP